MRKINIKGKEIVLRFDMAAMVEIEEKVGNLSGALKNLNGGDKMIKTITCMFNAMANSAYAYQGKQMVVDDTLIMKMSPAQIRKAAGAIALAVRDGMELKDDEEDDQVRDGYIQEVEEEKN